jgi:hypothetical protein
LSAAASRGSMVTNLTEKARQPDSRALRREAERGTDREVRVAMPAGTKTSSPWRVEQLRRTLKRDSEILFRHQRRRCRGYVLAVYEADLLVRFQQHRHDPAACVAHVPLAAVMRVLRP